MLLTLMFVVVLLLIVSICDTDNVVLYKKHAASMNTDDMQWKLYKSRYNKTYLSRDREEAARAAWTDNLLHVIEHNSAGHHSFTLLDNYLSDMTSKQYLRKVVKLVADKEDHPQAPRSRTKEHIPNEVDWTKLGFSPKVPKQRHCGACYAFSVTHALEAQRLRTTGKRLPLSEQQVVDCSAKLGNYGCGGGSLRATLVYLKKYGAMTYRDYPYSAKQGKCRWDPQRVVANISSWGRLPRGDEGALQQAIAAGPVPVSLNAAPRTFQLYHSGVYDDPACHGEHVNHAMLVVGYTTDHWLLLNWWGDQWGQKGYMKLKRGHNRCGIANYAFYLNSN